MVTVWILRPAREAVGLARRTERRARSRIVDDAGRTALAAVDALIGSAYADEAARHIADRVLAALDGPAFDLLVARALESPGARRAMAQIVESRVVEEAVARLAEDVIDRLRDSQVLWSLIREVVQSPEVSAAIAEQGAGFADQVGDELRERSRQADDRLERTAWRLLRRRGGEPSPTGAV